VSDNERARSRFLQGGDSLVQLQSITLMNTRSATSLSPVSCVSEEGKEGGRGGGVLGTCEGPRPFPHVPSCLADPLGKSSKHA
jgi:hypothetical protein